MNNLFFFNYSFVYMSNYNQYEIPSIGGKDGGATDEINHEKTGLICDGNELNDVYSSIENLLKDKKYIEYGKAAKINSRNFH